MSTLTDLLALRTLDAIVTRGRERFQIGLATPAEMATLAAIIDVAAGSEKDVLEDWRLVALRNLQSPCDAAFVLLGHATRQQMNLCTSDVVGLAVEHAVARTKHSIYRLGTAGSGEPPTQHILHLCATLHMWGFGEEFGVPYVYY